MGGMNNMKDYKICYGDKCSSKSWKNSYITWDAFLARLEKPVRTTETMAEYLKMPKTKKDKIKDIGGFLAGHLDGTRRKKDKVLSRSMITLDIDNGIPDFLEDVRALPDYRYVIYSTHKHKKEAPRFRLIYPLSRDVTPDEYEAVARMLAKDIGMEMMDKSTFEANRMMYWPSTSIDGEYKFIPHDGEVLDPERFLARYDDWKNISTWPRHPDEVDTKSQSGKKKQDPLELEGVVGAFCRTYSMPETIEKFLSEVYEPTGYENRYDYIPADSSAGVLVYEDKFLYSHHATDPASGKLLNAFEAVMIHKFPELDEKAQYKEMVKFAMEDDNVKMTLLQENLEVAKEEFSQADSNTKSRNNKWMARLSLDIVGNIDDDVENLILILENDKDFANFATNDLARLVEITGPVPWERSTMSRFWTDHDTSQLKALLDKRYAVFSTRNHDIAFDKVTTDRHFHPIRDYLNGLPTWDGNTRVEDLFIKYMEADDTDYIRTVTRKMFVAMVARVMEPGVKFDSIPVLDGAQGIGKSSIVRDLVGGDYYSETLSLTDMSDKTGAEKLQGFWCVEIGELAGMKKADIEKVKAFVTTRDDKYRPSYGKTVESHPRQCIIIATVNGERGYLRDITGNRRYWIIKLNQTEQKQKWKFDRYFIDQFWAEALYYYNKHEPLYLQGNMQKEAEKHQMEAMEKDDRLSAIELYLDTLLPENWDEMDIYQRRNFLDGDITAPRGTVRRTRVCNAEIWCECFKKNWAEMKTSDSYMISSLMVQLLEWKKTDRSIRIPLYGKQRVYERK